MEYFVTKATPNHKINGKCYIETRKLSNLLDWLLQIPFTLKVFISPKDGQTYILIVDKSNLKNLAFAGHRPL